MENKTTFKFYAVEGQPYVGAYRVGSFKEGSPQIMFAMDFFTYTLKDVPKEEQTEAFKDGLLQTITHEFCHAMQEMLDREYDELEVERVLGAYKPTWNTFEAPDEYTEMDTVFAVEDFLEWMEGSKSTTLEEFKAEINDLFIADKLWKEAKIKHQESLESK
jgi:hypothetical protein